MSSNTMFTDIHSFWATIRFPPPTPPNVQTSQKKKYPMEPTMKPIFFKAVSADMNVSQVGSKDYTRFIQGIYKKWLKKYPRIVQGIYIDLHAIFMTVILWPESSFRNWENLSRSFCEQQPHIPIAMSQQAVICMMQEDKQNSWRYRMKVMH